MRNKLVITLYILIGLSTLCSLGLLWEAISGIDTLLNAIDLIVGLVMILPLVALLHIKYANKLLEIFK